MPRTNEYLNTINFTEDDILSVIRKVDPDKPHRHDQISIRILQMWNRAICKSVYLISSSCIESGIFQTEWKMAIVVTIHKQDDKQNIKNYRPVSLLSIFGKIFRRLIYNKVYSYVIENDLISPN